MVDISAVAGIGDEGGPHAEAGADESVVDGGDGQQHGQGGLLGRGVAVGKAKDGDTLFDGGRGLVGKFMKALFEGIRATGGGE